MTTGRARLGSDLFPVTGTPRKFADIVGRIERLRNILRMKKSHFASAIGMKPQTYNNFIGAPGSKPNVELLHGIVTRFGANPMWVLTGAGSMFLEGIQQGSETNPFLSNRAAPSRISELARLNDDEFERELAKVRPVIEQIEAALARSDKKNDLLLDRLILALRQYVRVNPTESMAELASFLERIEKLIEKRIAMS